MQKASTDNTPEQFQVIRLKELVESTESYMQLPWYILVIVGQYPCFYEELNACPYQSATQIDILVQSERFKELYKNLQCNLVFVIFSKS